MTIIKERKTHLHIILVRLRRHVFLHKASFSSLLGLLIAGIFSATLFAFASPPASLYDLGETNDPNCAPGSTNCQATPPASYTFGDNDFSGSGTIQTASIIQGGTLTDGTLTITSGSIAAGVNAGFSGTVTAGQLQGTSLTAGRVPYVTTSGKMSL